MYVILPWKASEALLDPFPFGGGVTSLEGFAVGTPVVTMLPATLPGALTAGMYRRMGMGAMVRVGNDALPVAARGDNTKVLGDALRCCVALGIDEYVALLVHLGRNNQFREEVRRLIALNSASLYNDEASVIEWQRWLVRAATPAAVVPISAAAPTLT